MLIDWFTVAAQIVNFLVLVALLRHYLYGPVIRAMDRREERVVSRIRDAENKLQEAEGEKQLYLDRQEALDRQREELLVQAREEAEELRRKLVAEVRREVNESKERWHAALTREQETFLKELRQRAGLQVYAVAAKSLADLADASLERKIIGSFMKKLGHLDDDSRSRLQDAARGRAMAVVSAFALSREDQQRFGRQLQEIIGTAVELRFEIDPGLICGVKLNAHGSMVGWNLEEYLHELEQDLSQTLAEEVKGLQNGKNSEG
jgi:F-type H+-transporting ATPase subunit b